MVDKSSKDIRRTKLHWNEHAGRYDDYYKNFRGAVEQHVDLALLKKHLPKRNLNILDAAAGTGRIALPLAKMGHRVTLCDISPKMLEVAEKKMSRNGVLNKVKLFECDICKMQFPDKSFDFVICYAGCMKALYELARVTKKRGMISMCLSNRFGTAVSGFCEKPRHALGLLTMKKDHDCGEKDKYGVVSECEARKLMEKAGFGIIKIYACDLWNSLAIPKNILESRNWNNDLFNQTVEIILRLSQEPSIRGISRRWIVYGRRL
jgi:ubiquinone/menaquinone biosynthesis C-methylase UbiE